MKTKTFTSTRVVDIKPGDYIINPHNQEVKIKEVCLSELCTVLSWHTMYEDSFMYDNDDEVAKTGKKPTLVDWGPSVGREVEL